MSDNIISGEDRRSRWLARCQPWLTVLARMEIDSRLQGKYSAADVVQQTLLEAWRSWDQCRAEDEPQRMAWLRTILAHQLAHFARTYAGTQKRNVSREVSLDRSLAQSSVRLQQMIAAPGPSPASQAVASERQLQLAEALLRLPPDYRQVIMLRHIEDLPHEEVARRMNRSPGAVRMLWVRALAQLRQQLVEAEESSGHHQ